MAKASEIEIPSLLFDEQAAAPATPAAGFWRAYFKADGLYVIDDAGAEVGPLGVGGGAAAFIGARAYHSTTQSITNSTDTALLFNTEEYDTDTIHSTASNTGRFVVPAGMGGKWRFTGNASLSALASGSGTFNLKFRINGTTDVKGAAERKERVAGVILESNLTATLDLAAGDYVELVLNSSGGDTPTSGHASSDSVRNSLECQYLGA